MVAMTLQIELIYLRSCQCPTLDFKYLTPSDEALFRSMAVRLCGKRRGSYTKLFHLLVNFANQCPTDFNNWIKEPEMMKFLTGDNQPGIFYIHQP
jgi:hypothetical protein